MEFQTEAQQAVYQKIRPWFQELFGTFASFSEERPTCFVLVGSAWTNTTVIPWGDDDATICTRAWLVTGAELSADLLLYLLRENADMRFGAFSIDADDDILFEHTIVGSTCDKDELRSSVLAVAQTADAYDDEIVARFGGTRMIDRQSG
ncbi:MAG: hypothetical protein DCC58_00110 [Chloroflexi bacterium]|nr:MAG: hypothetical protein DCC58_00110 [Chloroflexota bacterium]